MSRKTKRGLPTPKDVLNSIESNIDFGYCAVHATETRSITISNPTTNTLTYKIKHPESGPFEFSHESGVLGLKGKQEINISYSPTECESIVSSVILTLNGEEKEIKLTAVAKFPVLSVSNNSLDFHELLVGKSEIKEIQVYNNGQVPTYFKVTKEPSEEEDQAFSATVRKGMIPPGESVAVPFKFQPKLVGVCSNAHYTIRSKGGNFISISCFGVGIGYDVHLSAKTMNFGEVSLGNTTNRLVNVVNDSDLATSFQFLVDKVNLFSFSITEGVVPARGSVRVIITFSPVDTISYYERVFCLIRNHKLLYLDLIGT